jgi:hypothetical protein
MGRGPRMWSVTPEVVDHLAIAFDVGAEDQYLEAVGAGLEGAGDAGADANGVEGSEFEEVVVELHLSGAGENDVDLFGAAVAVGECFPLRRFDGQEVDSGLLGAQVGAGEAGLLAVGEAKREGAVLDVSEVLLRVAHAGVDHTSRRAPAQLSAVEGLPCDGVGAKSRTPGNPG